MRPQHIMFLGFNYLTGVLISLTFGSGWLTSTELLVVNSLSAFKSVRVLGIWEVALPNVDFFLVGIKNLTMANFAFFTGPLEILRWFFICTIGIATIFGILVVMITLLTSVFRR